MGPQYEVKQLIGTRSGWGLDGLDGSLAEDGFFQDFLISCLSFVGACEKTPHTSLW